MHLSKDEVLVGSSAQEASVIWGHFKESAEEHDLGPDGWLCHSPDGTCPRFSEPPFLCCEV